MDNNTLFQAFLCLSYLGCLMLSILLALSGRRFRGAGLWITAQVFNTVAPFLDLARSSLPDWVTLVAANALYLAACPLYVHAIWALRFSSPFPRWLYLWIPLELLSFLLLFGSSEPTRMISFSIWLAVGMLSCGAFLVWKPQKEFRLLLGVAAASFFLVGLTSVVRVITQAPALFGGTAEYIIPVNLAYTARYVLVPTFLLFGYFMLTRVQAEQIVLQLDDDLAQKAQTESAISGAVPPESHLDERLRHFKISAREWEVARLVIDGLPSKEIGSRLFISPGTVKTHLQRLFRKTGCLNRAELVRTLLVGKKAAAN